MYVNVAFENKVLYYSFPLINCTNKHFYICLHLFLILHFTKLPIDGALE